MREISDKFKAMIVETAKYRQENNVVRNDYLDSIIAMKSKPLPYGKFFLNVKNIGYLYFNKIIKAVIFKKNIYSKI